MNDATLIARRLEEATEEAKKVLTEVHGLLKDLRQEKREALQLQKDLVFLSANLAKAEVQGAVGEQIRQAVEALGVATKAEMDKSVAKVIKEFDRLEAILLGKEKGDPRPSIEELILQRAGWSDER